MNWQALATPAPASGARSRIGGVLRFARCPEVLLGAWLNGFLLAMIVGHSRNPNLLFAALVAGAALVVVLTWGLPAHHRMGPVAAWASLALLAVILVGYAANLYRYDMEFVFGNVVSMVLALGMAYLVATRLDLDWRLVLASHAVVALLLMPEPIAKGQIVWGRLVPDGLHPNYLGMIAMVAFIGGLAVRSWFLRWVVLLATSAIMAAASSRGSMLASAVAALAYAAAGVCSATARAPVDVSARTVRVALAVLGLCAAALMAWLLAGASIEHGVDALLKLDDPYRGLASGASGRTEVWSAALALWEAQPLLGVGFKGHTFLMPQSLPAHSAYLGMLAETGLLGTTAYFGLCAAACAGLWRRRRDPRARAGIAVLASYLVYGIVETRAVGFGNAYSILFLWIAFDAARRPVLATPIRSPNAPDPTRTFQPEASPP